MSCSRFFPVIVAVTSFASSGCTHLESTSDAVAATNELPLRGVPYGLPALEYGLETNYQIVSCPTFVEVVDAYDGRFSFATKVKATPRTVVGERFVVDYQAMASFMKTSSYGLENYPSGVLKSVNVSAEDQSGPLIQNVASIGLSIAGLLSGNPVLAAAGQAMPSGVKGPMWSAEMVEGGRIKSFDGIGPAIADLRTLPRTEVITIVCNEDAERNFAEQSSARAALGAAQGGFDTATKDVGRLRIVTALKRSDKADVVALNTALQQLGQTELALAEAKEALATASAKLTVSRANVWQPSGSTMSIQPAEVDIGALNTMMSVKKIQVVDRADVLKWWGQWRDLVGAQIKLQYPALVAIYGLGDGDLPSNPKRAKPPHCAAGKSATDCLVDKLPVYAALGTSGQWVSETLPKGPIKGLLIRTPRSMQLTLCGTPVTGSADCPSGKALLTEGDVKVPQAGQYRFLPFRNRMFEAAQLNLALSENGEIEKFDYKRSKAASDGAAAVKDALGQYEAYRDKREKKASDALAAQRAEEVAAAQHEIDLLTKQKLKLDAQSSLNPDSKLAIETETALIRAEISQLESKRDKLKAEADLAAASVASGT